jgi:2-dehydropantoate 2-reductase
VIKHIYGDRFGLGEPNRRQTERVKSLAAAMQEGGLKAKIDPEISK